MNLQTANIQPVYSVESGVVYAANGHDVYATLVDGKVLMLDRKLRTIDLPATMAAAEAMKNKVLASLKK